MNFPQIHVLDINNEVVLRYLRLADDQYFGGVTHQNFLRILPFAYGPHVMMNTAGMLDLIANIANLDNEKTSKYPAYSIQGDGNGYYEREQISREMHADRLANVLGCDEQVVRDHYDRMVMIPKEKDHA